MLFVRNGFTVFDINVKHWLVGYGVSCEIVLEKDIWIVSGFFFVSCYEVFLNKEPLLTTAGI